MAFERDPKHIKLSCEVTGFMVGSNGLESPAIVSIPTPSGGVQDGRGADPSIKTASKGLRVQVFRERFGNEFQNWLWVDLSRNGLGSVTCRCESSSGPRSGERRNHGGCG